MARRSGDDEKRAAAATEAAGHGGLVALAGGRELGWYWRDDWDRQSRCARFAGYVETEELIENRDSKDPRGVHLRWYGKGVVFRYDPSLVPVSVSPAVEPLPPVYCVCGERLLLLLPNRQSCERCRLGVTTPAVVWRPHGAAPSEPTEPTAEVIPNLDELDTALELESPPEVEVQPSAPPTLDPAEVADFVWRSVAHLYDR